MHVKLINFNFHIGNEYNNESFLMTNVKIIWGKPFRKNLKLVSKFKLLALQWSCQRSLNSMHTDDHFKKLNLFAK